MYHFSLKPEKKHDMINNVDWNRKLIEEKIVRVTMLYFSTIFNDILLPQNMFLYCSELLNTKEIENVFSCYHSVKTCEVYGNWKS